MPPVAEEMGGTGLNPAPHHAGKRKTVKASSHQHHQQEQVDQHQQSVSNIDAKVDGGGRAPPEGTLGSVDITDDVDTAPAVAMLQVTGHSKQRRERKTTMDRYSSDPSAATEFFKKEPCIHSHRMFDRASKIFEGLKKAKEAKMAQQRDHRRAGGGMGQSSVARGASPLQEPPSIPPMDFRNATEKKLTYELAFASLKYENVFEEMLEDCAFFTVYPELKDDECLVMVVLWDYQSRKFQPRVQFDAGELLELVTGIEKAIMDQKTKLAASLARRRIRASAPNIEYLLPDKLRSKASSQKPLPVYAWVNTAKINPTDLLQRLKEEGFTQLWMPPKTVKEFKEKNFYLDTHCSDLLVFSLDCNSILQEHALIEQGYLVRQDKSSCLAAHSVLPLLGDEQDVIVVNPGAGLTAAHLGVLLKDRKCGVIVVSEHSDEDHNKMMRNIELIGVTKYVKVIRETFVEMDIEDIRLRSVRAALVLAQCSKSAISNIVNYIVTEGENLKLLQDLSEQSDDLDEQMNRLQADHIGLLRHALKLNKIQGVTYLTRSIHDQENDAVVQRAIEYVNMVQMAKKLRPWRVIPPVIPFSSEEIDDQVGIQGKHTSFMPSEFMNGCFIVCIAREPEDPVEMAARMRAGRGVGAKASRSKMKTLSKGSLNSSNPSDSQDSLKGKKKDKGKKAKAGAKVSVSTVATRARTRSPHPLDQTPEHVKVVKHPAPFR